MPQPKNDAKNGSISIFLSPWHARLLNLATQVFKMPKSDQKWVFYGFQSNLIFATKFVSSTISELRMVMSIGTPISCWKLTFAYFSHYQVCLDC